MDNTREKTFNHSWFQMERGLPLRGKETKLLLESIPTTRGVKDQGEENGTSNLIGLRDRALIAAMFFTFARVGAVVAMTVEDHYPQQGQER